MLIRTELSGVGHYGVCTVVFRDDLEKLLALLSSSPVSEGWENFELDPWKPMGFNGSFQILTKDQAEPEIKLAWYPGRLSDALVSHGLLMRGMASFTEKGKSPRALEVFSAKTSSDWHLQADFGDDIWDVIESSDFAKILPKINAEIRSWWEDQSGVPELGQYTIVFGGRNGPTLQVYQPRGSGLWICGSRHGGSSHQLTDHNTDSSRDCFAHVLSLCMILKHCRAVIESAGQFQ